MRTCSPSQRETAGTHDSAIRVQDFIEKEAEKERAKAEQQIGPVAAAKVFQEELDHCEKTLRRLDVDAMLRLVEGKTLLATLAPLAGCQDGSALLRGVKTHLQIAEYPRLQLLQSKLLKGLRRPQKPGVATGDQK